MAALGQALGSPAVTSAAIPLFPLSTVLFPEGPLPLRVFEPRYLDMVSRCLRSDSGFGVVLIVGGSDTGAGGNHHRRAHWPVSLTGTRAATASSA